MIGCLAGKGSHVICSHNVVDRHVLAGTSFGGIIVTSLGGGGGGGGREGVEKYSFKLLLKAFNYCFSNISTMDCKFCSPIELDFNCIHFFGKFTYSDQSVKSRG